MSSFLRVIVNGKEIEGWKKNFVSAVVIIVGVGLVVFAVYVVILGLMAVFGVLPGKGG